MEKHYWTSVLSCDSTMGHGTNQCLWVMVTVTVCPTMRYSPLTISCEKRPDRSSPTRIASFSLAALLALSSSEEGVTVVAKLKVLCTNFVLPRSRGALTRGLATLCKKRDNGR